MNSPPIEKGARHPCRAPPPHWCPCPPAPVASQHRPRPPALRSAGWRSAEPVLRVRLLRLAAGRYGVLAGTCAAAPSWPFPVRRSDARFRVRRRGGAFADAPPRFPARPPHAFMRSPPLAGGGPWSAPRPPPSSSGVRSSATSHSLAGSAPAPSLAVRRAARGKSGCNSARNSELHKMFTLCANWGAGRSPWSLVGVPISHNDILCSSALKKGKPAQESLPARTFAYFLL